MSKTYNHQPAQAGASLLPDGIKQAPKSNKRVSSNLTKMRLLNTCSGFFFAFGAYGLTDPQSTIEWLEVGMLGLAGGVAAYSVNHIGITKGAYQAAIKAPGAAAASLGAMALAGVTISIASFTGAVINPVDQNRLQEFGRENAAYVEARIDSVARADEVIIAAQSAYAQIKASRLCEELESCVSRRGNGGRGTAFYTLQSAETEISTVLEKLTEGETLRDEALEALLETNAVLQDALNITSPSRKARRMAVQEQISEQNAALLELDRALPLSLVGGLAGELERGVEIPGNADLTKRINERLAKAGSGISAVLGSGDVDDIVRPTLPRETGVLETLGWLGHYLPLAGVLFLIDAVFPILLWFFTFLSIRPLVEIEDEENTDPFDFTNTVEMPPVQINRSGNGAMRGDARRRRN
jgi:hypothetical protein